MRPRDVIHMTHSKITFERKPERWRDKRENGWRIYEKGDCVTGLKGLKIKTKTEKSM